MRVKVGAALERQAGSAGTYSTREAFGEWVTGLARWDWFATLTYDDDRIRRLGVAGWDRAGWGYGDRTSRAWLDSLSPDVQFARFREANERGGWHFHALVAGVPRNARRSDAWGRWFDTHGLARVVEFDARLGGGYYVSKYVTKEQGEISWKLKTERQGPGLLSGQAITSWDSYTT